jgi:hypothetical protein
MYGGKEPSEGDELLVWAKERKNYMRLLLATLPAKRYAAKTRYYARLRG